MEDSKRAGSRRAGHVAHEGTGILHPSETPWERIGPLFTPPDEYQQDGGTYPSALTLRDGRPVQTAQEWQERRQEILRDWQEMLGPWPPLLDKPDIIYLEEEKTENFTRHKARIQIAPERWTLAYLLVPDGAGPFPAVLDVFYTPEDGAGLNPEKRQQHDFGYQLARRGFVALCVGQQPGKEESPIYYPNVNYWEPWYLGHEPGSEPRKAGVPIYDD